MTVRAVFGRFDIGRDSCYTQDEQKERPAVAATGHNYQKIDNTRREVFLTALEDSFGNFSHACRVASPLSKATNGKPCYSSFKRLMTVSPSFAEEVAQVMNRVRDRVSAEITKRAIEGIDEPIFQKGERASNGVDKDGKAIPASITRHDNKLLLRLAAKLDPENWGLQEQRHDHRVTVHSSGRALCSFGMRDLDYLSLEQREQLTGIMVRIQGGREQAGMMIDGGEIELLEFDDGDQDEPENIEELVPY